MSLRVSSSLFFLWTFLSFDTALADKNVTVDDSDSAIEYSSGWSVSSPSNSLDYGGFHHLSSDKTSTASFTFTGTAVYIMAPLWPYAVGCEASVDGSSPVLVSMQDTSHTTSGGSEDVASAVLWGMKDLSNSSHTLQISFADNEQFMALDAIVYTVPDSGTTSSSTISSSSNAKSSSFTATSSSASSSNTAIAASSAESKTDKNHMALIAGGVGAAIVLGLMIMTACICFSRIRRKIRNRYRRGNTSGALPVTAASFIAGSTGPSRTFQGRAYASTLPDSPTMESVPLPNENYSSYENANTMSNYGQANPYQQHSNVNPATNSRPSVSDQSASQHSSERYASTAYTPAMTMASVAAAATTSGPYVTTSLVDPFADHGNAAGGSSSSRSDVYTTVTSTTGGSEEKARLKLAYREADEAPPTYS